MQTINLSSPAAQISLMQTAMPPMVMAGALASIAELKPQLISAIAANGTLLSFLTLPLICSNLRHPYPLTGSSSQ